MTTNRPVYHVLPNGDKGWKAQNVGTDSVVAQGENKEDLVNQVKDRARGEEPSQVVVHQQDGTIQYESTYGDDPERFKG